MNDSMLGRTGFLYCPRCAARALVPHERKACRCEACGFRYYQNSAAAVVGVVEAEGHLVLGRRARDPQRGFWSLPGGFVDNRETLEQAIRRETREETGLEVEVVRYLGSAWNEYPYAGVAYLSTDVLFHCRVLDLGRLCAGDEVTEVVVVEPREIDLETLAFESYRLALAAYLATLS